MTVRAMERNRIVKRMAKADRRLEAAEAQLKKLKTAGGPPGTVAALKDTIREERKVKAHLNEALTGIGG